MQTDIDKVARTLMQMGRMGHDMPPAWDGAKCKTLVGGPGMENIGYLLPGRGLYLDTDLKSLGIKGRLPNVYERSRLLRLVEIFDKMLPNLDSELGAIQTYDAIISARSSGQFNDVPWTKGNITSVANQWSAIMRATGQPPAMVFNATTAPTETATDRATVGALSLGLSNPTGSNRKYLLTFGFASAATVNFMLVIDIHVQGGAFRLTVNTAETVAAPVTVVRNYGNGPLGSGNCLSFVETTASSATAHNFTTTYVNQAGTAGQTTVLAAPATAGTIDGIYPVAAMNWFIPLAAGDFGIRSVSSTISSVALAAGVLALILHYPLMLIPGVTNNVYIERDSTVQIDALTELANSAQVIGCLGVLVFANGTSTGPNAGMFRTCEG